jgi:DNA modification methylase
LARQCGKEAKNMTTQRIIPGDCIEGLRTLPDASVHCCVTSPPYWGLRDYGHDGQIGLESTPEAYVARMVEVFREVRRVLRDDGTCWVNLGDSYAANAATSKKIGESHRGSDTPTLNQPHQCRVSVRGGEWRIKAKDLVGIPWRVAFALQADGWWLRQDIIWHKPNPMPESVRDRCTKAHEYVFLLTKSERYYYDAEAVSEASVCLRGPGNKKPLKGVEEDGEKHRTRAGLHLAAERWRQDGPPLSRNRRSVWTITTKPYSGAHFAVMPPDLVEPCIKAGCPEGGTVLDPFVGSGTTLAVAAELGRSGIGCELNPAYIALAQQRITTARGKRPLFA